MIVRQLEVGPMAVFAYIVGDEEVGEAAVIDPAAEAALILAEAEALGVSIKKIINTHGHVDHIGANGEIKNKTGAKIIIHEHDAPLLVSTPALYFHMFGAKPSPPADLTVREGDVIRVGNLALRVIHTPGHTPGSMCLYLDGMVFTGDTLFVGSVGRTDLPGGSWAELHRSLLEKLAALPDDTRVMPGHNYGPTPVSTIGHEKRHNPFME